MNATAFQLSIIYEPPPLLIERFSRDNHVPEEEAHQLFAETKKFLAVCADDRTTSFSPSKKVDEMWHAFVLFTKDYFRFCNIFGEYIHHRPLATREPQNYEQTLLRLRSLFGEPDSRYWGETAGDCKCEGSARCDPGTGCKD